MQEIKYRPIGIIHSPFKESKGTPIQSGAAEGIDGTVEVFSEYTEGLKDLKGFSYIILLFHFHLSGMKLSGMKSLKVKPYLDNNPHGIFATRAPCRPNAIGLSIVKLIKIKRNILYIQDIDIVDESPLLDIKPYVPEFDIRKADNIGWLQKRVNKLSISKDDGRFTK